LDAQCRNAIYPLATIFLNASIARFGCLTACALQDKTCIYPSNGRAERARLIVFPAMPSVFRFCKPVQRKDVLEMRACLCLVACLAAGLLTGCRGGQSTHPYTVSTGGNAPRGRETMVTYGCGKCHNVPGIHGANGVVGPPLVALSRRTYIAGNFPNTPENLVHWVMAPQSMKPKTAMPELGLTEPQARDVAAYLYTLR